MSPIGQKTIDLLTVKIGSDIDDALEGIGELSSKVNSFATGFRHAATTAAAAGAAVLGAAVKTGQWADELLDLRDQTNLSLRELQEFRQISIQAGVGMDTVAEAVQKMQVRMASGEEGSADLRIGLEQLGVSLTDVDGRSRDMGDVMTEVIGKLGDMEDVTKRNVTATRIFGRSATELMPLLSMGSEEIATITQRSRELGLVMSDENVEAANKFRAEFDLVTESLKAQARELSVQTIPWLTALAEKVNGIVEEWRMIGTSVAGGPSIAAQGIINSLPDDIGALQSRFVDFFEMLPESTTAMAMSIDELQAKYEELGITQTDVNFILSAITDKVGELATTTREELAPAFLEVNDRVIEFKTTMELGSLAIDETNFSLQHLNEVREYGAQLTRDLMTAEELYAEQVQRLDALLNAEIITLETHTRGIQAATAALNEQANAARNDASAIGELGSAWGDVASIMGLFGVSLPFLGPAIGLLGRFAGGFAEGGDVPAGQWAVVGEEGPEIVTGPAHVTPMGGSPKFVLNVPPARDPITLARDRQWMGAFQEMLDSARHLGYRFS